MSITRNISLAEIQANPYQPRIQFTEDSLVELAQSIKENGVIQPVIVRKASHGYELIAGERRCKAARLAGLKDVPCLVIDANDDKAARLALIENIQREDLDPLEEAQAYKDLLNLEKCTQSELAYKVCKKQSTIANKIRLLGLSDEIKKALANGKIAERQARALLRIPTDKQEKVYETIIERGLDSRKTEEYIGELLEPREKEVKKEHLNKLYLKDVRIALNTINQAVDSLKNTNLEITKETKETEEGYQIIIDIKKL